MIVRYEQHCPVARATEILGDSWTFLVVHELLYGDRTAADLQQALPGLAAGVLSTRLRRLRAAGLVDDSVEASRHTRYALTSAGRDLAPIIDHLGHWGRRWLPSPGSRDLKPQLLVHDICRQIERSRLPPQPAAVRVRFAEVPPPRQWWIVLSTEHVSARHSKPGLPDAIRIDCTLTALAQIWLGHTSWLDAVREQTVRFTGPREMVHQAIHWIGTSRFSPGRPSTAAD